MYLRINRHVETVLQFYVFFMCKLIDAKMIKGKNLCMHILIYVCMACIYVCMYVCVCVCVCVCVYVCMNFRMIINKKY